MLTRAQTFRSTFQNQRNAHPFRLRTRFESTMAQTPSRPIITAERLDIVK